jgi:hypothetical protein
MNVTQSIAIVPLVRDGDYNAGFTADSLDMAQWNHCAILMAGDSSVATDSSMVIYGGATAAATTAAITAPYRWTAVAVGTTASDVWADWQTAAASFTLTAASLAAGYSLIVEFDASALDISGTQYRYVTPVVASTGAAGTVNMWAILTEPRIQRDILDTVV